MIFVKISQNFIKSHLKICLISQSTAYGMYETIYYFVYVTVLKIDIPVLTDLDNQILKSLKGPGYNSVGCMYVWFS